MLAPLAESYTRVQTPLWALVLDLKDKLAGGESFDNKRLTESARRVFGGTRGAGAYSPRDAYDAMEAAVNLYLLEAEGEPGARALMRTSDVGRAVAGLRDLMRRLPRQTDRTHEQTERQQFSTPPTLAYLAARVLNPFAATCVLEPSAGTGSLIVWARAAGAETITNEIDARRRELLRGLGFDPFEVDAEFLDDLLPAAERPTAVLMNPPFSATGGRVARHRTIYGARHVEAALKRLATGGRLVAIVGEGMGLDRPVFSEWWQRIAATYNVRANLRLPGNEYGKYGTTFDDQLLVIDKTGPTPGVSWAARLERIIWKNDDDSIEGVWGRVAPLVTGEGDAANAARPVATVTAGAERGDAGNAGEDDGDDGDDNSCFVEYVPARLTGGRPHPAQIVESVSMAAVEVPEISYRLHLAPEIITEGRLSIVQLERVVYAGQRHEQRLPDGARGGFFVGDGTGVGKGRILAGIIADNWNQDRRRALWLSVNNDLIESTRRDLSDLGMRVPLARINDYAPSEEITLPEGVIFSSYSSLIAQSRTGELRLDQIRRWLGGEGVVIFDEAHRAKNALQCGRGEATQTGQAVIDLQSAERNPDYRVVYASATGATDVRNMAYMTRLGLWGAGTAFPGGFQEFLTEIEAGGVGAMEMVSRDMKALGMYASCSISFGVDPLSGKAVEYREVVHRLTPGQREMYDAAARSWQVVLQNIDEALAETNGGRRARGVALNKYWGDHQRFFRQVIGAFKVPAVIAEAERALADDKSVIISLVGTGEARTREKVSQAMAEGGSLQDLDFSPRETIASMVERGFPTTLYCDQTDAATGQTIKVPVKDRDGNIVHSREALMMKARLLDGLSSLDLPENPLDQLVNHFGAENVAELTGRTRRLIRDKRTGRVEYQKRAPEGVAMDKVNVYEMEQFQAGRKRIAIISDAASTGISLHASNRAPNKQRRVQITLELGWSADKQMQTFGRSHRSDQAVPPEYVLLSTELGGEKRFASTIARRLGSLGALTKGDRGAADASDLAKYNFETEEGRAALALCFRRVMSNDGVPGLDNPKQALRDIGLLVKDREGGEGIRKDDEFNVPRFLNRVLALDVGRQNALFNFYADLFDQTIAHAKASGTFDTGVADIKGVAIRLHEPPRVVHLEEVTKARTTHYRLEVDRRTDAVSFERAERSRAERGGAFLRHRKTGDFILALESRRHTDPNTGRTYATFAVWKPHAPRTRYIHEPEVAEKYQPATPEEAREWWTRKHAAVPMIETVETHIIGGAIIPLWQRLKTQGEAQLKVVRVTTDAGQRIVGVLIPAERVRSVLRALGLGGRPQEPGAIYQAVLEGEEIELASNLKLRATQVHGERRIELINTTPPMFAVLRETFRLINENINWKQRFFVPLDETSGVETLSRLLASYPVINTAPDADACETAEASAREEVRENDERRRRIDVISLCAFPDESGREHNEIHSGADKEEATCCAEQPIVSGEERSIAAAGHPVTSPMIADATTSEALNHGGSGGRRERAKGVKDESRHRSEECGQLGLSFDDRGNVSPNAVIKPMVLKSVNKNGDQLCFDWPADEKFSAMRIAA